MIFQRNPRFLKVIRRFHAINNHRFSWNSHRCPHTHFVQISHQILCPKGFKSGLVIPEFGLSQVHSNQAYYETHRPTQSNSLGS